MIFIDVWIVPYYRNFLMWVHMEAWMERPDLNGHYKGRQAVDATPQEPSVWGGPFAAILYSGSRSLVSHQGGEV